jgi:hypothetical protein
MPKEVRELTGERTLLDVCMDLHMHNNGSAPDLFATESDKLTQLRYLKLAIKYWTPGFVKDTDFDNAVKKLVMVTIIETEISVLKSLQ